MEGRKGRELIQFKTNRQVQNLDLGWGLAHTAHWLFTAGVSHRRTRWPAGRFPASSCPLPSAFRTSR